MECPICKGQLFDASKRLKVTNCGHLFHEECIDLAVKSGFTNCPSCNTRLMTRSLRTVYGTDGSSNQHSNCSPRCANTVEENGALMPKTEEAVLPSNGGQVNSAVEVDESMPDNGEAVLQAEVPQANMNIDVSQITEKNEPPKHKSVTAAKRTVRFNSAEVQVRVGSALIDGANTSRRSRRAMSLDSNRVHLYQEPASNDGTNLRRSNRIRAQVERMNYNIIRCCICKKSYQQQFSGKFFDIDSVCSFECIRKGL